VSLSTNFPTIRPTLYLDFAKSRTVDPRITFTRASTATYFDEDGVLQTAAVDRPRIDFNPSTLVCNGLLIEEARTNSIRNNTMVGAVAGSPGTLPTNWAPIFNSGTGLTQEIVGTGTENGITYIDIKFSGTATSSGTIQIFSESITGVVASVGQTWTSSGYWKIAAGGTTGLSGWAINLQELTSIGGFLAQTVTNVSAPTSAALSTQRVSSTVTLGNASTARTYFSFLFNYANGTAYNFTLRIGLPQLEQGAFATSVIPTTTTALTRNADVASMTGTNFSSWYSASEGTLYSETLLTRQNATAGTNTFYISNASTNEIKIFYRATGATGSSVVDTGVDQANLSPTGVLTANTIAKIAFAYKANDFATSGNGGAVVTDTSGTVPAGMSQALFGAPNGILNGTIRRIAYYPARLVNAQLQALTL
jgi:hypothetical protein